MATASSLTRKHKSGLSYARAAKVFGITEQQAREYARQAREYNKAARQWARAYGYKEDLWQAPSLMNIKQSLLIPGTNKFGTAADRFKYLSTEVRQRLADNPKRTLVDKAEQYVANIMTALTNNPESSIPGSDTAKALEKLQSGKFSIRKIMRATGGSFFESYYGRKAKTPVEGSDMINILLAL